MNDDQYFLANAYLDGELTADERAIAESDPEVMAEVAELRALQDLLRAVDPPDDATRRGAIAAAMSEFTGAAAADTAGRPPAPAPIPYRPRPSYSKYLAVAAGVLGVGLLGVAVANLGTGGDDDAADTAEEPAAEEPAAEEPSAELPIEEGDVMVADDGDRTTSAIAGDEVAEEPAEEPMEEPAESAAEEPASEPAEEPAEEPAAEEPAAEEPADGGPSAERPVLVPGQVLATPEELGSYGTGLVEQQRDGTLPATPNHACPIDDVLGRAEYLVDATVVPILVAVDEPAGVVLAFADDTCELVVEGPLYPL